MTGLNVRLLAKSRALDDESVILLNLNRRRHFGGVLKAAIFDIEYAEKKDSVVWRGATTGKNTDVSSRTRFVNEYFDHPRVDAGFSVVVQNREECKKFLKSRLHPKEQLEHKFIVSLEGNDVASGLKWQLYSNSVVMMPPVTRVSWIMEDRLKPFVHYIPLKSDFSDLVQMLDWALEHEKECIEISRNATEYMQQFLHAKRERKIEKALFRKYFENVEFF